jgi:hypothetical protein
MKPFGAAGTNRSARTAAFLIGIITAMRQREIDAHFAASLRFPLC